MWFFYSRTYHVSSSGSYSLSSLWVDAHYLIHTMWHSGLTFLPNSCLPNLFPSSLTLPALSILYLTLGQLRKFVLLHKKRISWSCRRLCNQGSKLLHFCVAVDCQGQFFFYHSLHLPLPNSTFPFLHRDSWQKVFLKMILNTMQKYIIDIFPLYLSWSSAKNPRNYI